jgi:hypothetical protein
MTEHKRNVKYIRRNFTKLENNIIDEMHKKIWCMINEKSTYTKKNEFDLNKKINYIKYNLRYLSEKHFQEISNDVKPIIDEITYKIKYDLTLDIANKMLITCDKPKITNLTDFNVVRHLLLTEECKAVIMNNIDDIFAKGFERHICRYNERSKTLYYQLSIFKGMLKQIGYVLKSTQKDKRINNKRTSYYYYTIEQCQ